MPKHQYEPSTQEWFSDFIHGYISPTDVVLAPVERRILPPLVSQCHASDRYPSWFHIDSGVGYDYETKSSLWGQKMAFWIRAEPTANGNGNRAKAVTKIGGGVNCLKDSTPPNDNNNSTTTKKTSYRTDSSWFRSGAFVDFTKNHTHVSDWYSGASFVHNSTNSDFTREGNHSGKWQVSFQVRSHNNNNNNSNYSRTALAFLHWNYVIPWWLGGTLLTKGYKPSLASSSSLGTGSEQKSQNKHEGAISSSSSNTIISYYTSISIQQDPLFAMIRLNASVPVSPFSEFSIGTDPYRRFHAALCTQLNHYVDFGMRLRLNTISWHGAGIDVGAMINATSLWRGGRPKSAEEMISVPSVRIGVQSTLGESVHIFADIFRSEAVANLKDLQNLQEAEAKAMNGNNNNNNNINNNRKSVFKTTLSWFNSLVKSVQIGVGFSRLGGGSNNNNNQFMMMGGNNNQNNNNNGNANSDQNLLPFFSLGNLLFANRNGQGKIGMDTFIKIEF